jgi:hypothetical protein
MLSIYVDLSVAEGICSFRAEYRKYYYQYKFKRTVGICVKCMGVKKVIVYTGLERFFAP